MMFRTHEIAGLVACTAALPILNKLGLDLNVLECALIFSGGAMGAMFPDIDSPTSKVRRGIRKVFTGNPNTDKRVINHRREPHMPFIWAILFALLFFAINNLYVEMFLIGMAIGVTSHLFIDMMNPAGIPLLGPFYRKKISILPIKTNSWGENIIAILLVLIEIYLIYYLFFTDSGIINILALKF